MPSCCFTGHRTIPGEQYAVLCARLQKEIETLIQKGVTEFRTGGALGFDTLAALCVLSYKKLNPNIKLYVHVPHRGQESMWSEDAKAAYHYILNCADEVITLAETYSRGCMHARNRHMVDHSDYVIAYLQRKFGGSAYTVSYAREKNVPIIFV